MAGKDCSFSQTYLGFNQVLCENKPVFSARTANLVDTQSIAFISELELNTVGSFSDPASYVIYGSPISIKAISAPQELAVSGALPLGVVSPPPTTPGASNNKELSAYILPLGGDTPSSADLTVVWPAPGPGASGRVSDVFITGRDCTITTMTGPGVSAQTTSSHGTWSVRRSPATVSSQDISITLSNFRAGVAPVILFHFVVPVV